MSRGETEEEMIYIYIFNILFFLLICSFRPLKSPFFGNLSLFLFLAKSWPSLCSWPSASFLHQLMQRYFYLFQSTSGKSSLWFLRLHFVLLLSAFDFQRNYLPICDYKLHLEAAGNVHPPLSTARPYTL